MSYADEMADAANDHGQRFTIATVIHHNGFILRGLVTGGDGNGIFVQPSGIEKQAPIFAAFVNVKSITFEV